MQFKNTFTQYGIVSVILHWLMAVIIIGMLILGLYMVRLPISFEKLRLYGIHKEFGVLVLLLAMIRLFWRVINTLPILILPWIEIFAARLVHWSFYFLMFAIPITGWCMSSAAGLPVSFFGLFVLPDLVHPNEITRLQFLFLHKWLGYLLILAIVLHALAALKHHFINKDDILRRIFYV